MAEYIDREVLEEALNRRYSELTDEYGPYDQYTDGYGDAIGVVESFPNAADVAPVVHGRWAKHYRSGVTVHEGWVSSCCDMWNGRESDYCPHCGAKMYEKETNT